MGHIQRQSLKLKLTLYMKLSQGMKHDLRLRQGEVRALTKMRKNLTFLRGYELRRNPNR